jgi:hypothetical protein
VFSSIVTIFSSFPYFSIFLLLLQAFSFPSHRLLPFFVASSLVIDITQGMLLFFPCFGLKEETKRKSKKKKEKKK